jgi:hypothetical protein
VERGEAQNFEGVRGQGIEYSSHGLASRDGDRAALHNYLGFVLACLGNSTCRIFPSSTEPN